MSTTAAPSSTAPRTRDLGHHRVVVVGTGFGGIAVAHRLREAGIDDVVLLERAGDVGGVWRDNDYPGCACDVQSHLYSLSFAPNPDWGETFSGRDEIHAYLRRTVDALGLRDRIRLHEDVRSQRWDEATHRWGLETSVGRRTADHVVIATGALADPVVPDLPGLASFAGPAFHTARGDHDVDLTGKRVVVVGTGASAIQFVPAIQPEVARLTLFQRTPPWVMPRHDGPIDARTRGLMRRVPLRRRLERLRIFVERELFVLGFRHPTLMKAAQRTALSHLEEQVSDPELRAKLTPDYTLGCKRILLSNAYLRALDQANADVVTTGVREVRAHGVVDGNGVEHPADVLIFGTGFHTQEMPLTQRTTGRDGRTMSETWAGSPRAYLGTTVAGFPNAYLVHGPNIGLGHTSVLHMLESQAAYVADAVRWADEHGVTALEPTRRAQDAFVEDVERLGRGTVWTAGGCTSWYLDETGRNSNLWPGSVLDYRRRARRFDPAAHVLRTLPAAR